MTVNRSFLLSLAVLVAVLGGLAIMGSSQSGTANCEELRRSAAEVRAFAGVASKALRDAIAKDDALTLEPTFDIALQLADPSVSGAQMLFDHIQGLCAP